MIEKLTKKKALEICIELWTWLAETGSKYKLDWPGWRKGRIMQEACPCCEYSIQNGHNKCPIWICKDIHKGCLSHNSPFIKWENAEKITTRKKYAQQIVGLAKQKLSEL